MPWKRNIRETVMNIQRVPNIYPKRINKNTNDIIEARRGN